MHKNALGYKMYNEKIHCSTPRDGTSVWCPALSPLTSCPGASADCHWQGSSVHHRTWFHYSIVMPPPIEWYCLKLCVASFLGPETHRSTLTTSTEGQIYFGPWFLSPIYCYLGPILWHGGLELDGRTGRRVRDTSSSSWSDCSVCKYFNSLLFVH